MSPTDEQVSTALAGVLEPLLRKPLGDLGLNGPVKVDGSRVEVTVALLTDEHPAVDELDARIIDDVGAIEGVRDVVIHHTVLDDELLKHLVDRLHTTGIP